MLHNLCVTVFCFCFSEIGKYKCLPLLAVIPFTRNRALIDIHQIRLGTKFKCNEYDLTL